jgi:spermidine/putrescine ABC transporter ATP-binding subunit
VLDPLQREGAGPPAATAPFDSLKSDSKLDPAARPAVELKHVTLAYGAFLAVKDVSLAVGKGSFVTLLGPSGCGKTTILRAIAGLVHPTRGDIAIAGRSMAHIPIHRRNIGLVFQNYALFPHKTVFDNIGFGLKYRNVEKTLIGRKVARALEMVRLSGVEKKLPSELSGGQQQRIALARAIVVEPDVLLLDEPLSALDANLRDEMRTELKMIQREVGITTIFVTHDQHEALAMSDRIVVMNHGLVEQEGTPEEVYRQPASRFVASFLGQSNMLSGRVASSEGEMAKVALDGGAELLVKTSAAVKAGAPVTVLVRAQSVEVGTENRKEGPNLIKGRVMAASYLGSTASYRVKVGRMELEAINMIDRRFFRDGEEVWVAIAPATAVLFDESGKRLTQ